MRRIDSVADKMKGVVTYELPDGKCIRLDEQAVRDHGAANILRDMGLGELLPTERLPVIFHGERIGTMSPYFDPDNIKSHSFMYEPRKGDFTRGENVWIAASSLGLGDIEAVAGFSADRSEPQPG